MTTIRLRLPGYRYRFDLLLEFVKRIAHPARMLVQDDSLWRVTAGQLVSYRLEGDEIVARAACLSASDEARLRERSRRVLGIDRDLDEFYAWASGDDQLWRVIGPLAGFPLFCTETVFEALITLIIEQHITWKNALRAQRTLLQLMGTEVEAVGRRIFDFPKADDLAQLEPEALKPLKITNGRIDTIIELSRAVSAGQMDLEALADLDAQAAYERLKSIRGVGHWTAANVLGRAFGKYAFVSHNDVALQAAVQHYFELRCRQEIGATGSGLPDAIRSIRRHRRASGAFALGTRSLPGRV